MKRTRICLLALVMMIVSVFGGAAYAEGVALEEALGQVGSGEGLVRLSDDFSKYDYYSSPVYTGNEGKYVVLYRVGPEKEFTISDEPFADSFNGVDIGEAEVYLDLDMMAKIPEEHRATTVEEIGNIIMFESFYLHNGTIISTSSLSGSDSGPSKIGLIAAMQGEDVPDEELPEEEEEEYVSEYKAVFIGVAVAALYNAEDGSSCSFQSQTFPYAEMRSNPEASTISDTLYLLADVYNACLSEDYDALSGSVEILTLNAELDEAHVTAMDEMLYADTMDYGAFFEYTVDMIWEYAAQLREADKKNGDYYGQVIEQQSLNGLFYLLANCDYNSVEKADFLIKMNKDYLGKIDLSCMDEMKEFTFSTLDSFEWDNEMISLLVQLGAM